MNIDLRPFKDFKTCVSTLIFLIHSLHLHVFRAPIDFAKKFHYFSMTVSKLSMTSLYVHHILQKRLKNLVFLKQILNFVMSAKEEQIWGNSGAVLVKFNGFLAIFHVP